MQLLNNLLNRLMKGFKPKTDHLPITDNDAECIQTDLCWVCKDAIGTRRDGYKYVVETMMGPHQYIVKLINTTNLRILRVEIPKPTHHSQDVALIRLERRHNIIDHLDEFYESTTEYLTDYDELFRYFSSEECFDDWFTLDVDRSSERVSFNATIIPEFGAVPRIENLVYVDIIKDVQWANSDTTSDQMAIVETMYQKDPIFVSAVPSNKIKYYRRGAILVTNHNGKMFALPFGKARHYLKFDNFSWRRICMNLAVQNLSRTKPVQ